MKSTLLSLAVLCLSASTVLSGFSANAGSQVLTFDEIRLACKNPAQFHNQVAPAHIQIACRDIQTRWVSDADGTMTMEATRDVSSELSADKYTVSPFAMSVQVTQPVVACANYKQVRETVETIRASSCDEIIAFTGSTTDFCVDAVNAIRAENPEAIVRADTDLHLSLCSPTLKNN